MKDTPAFPHTIEHLHEPVTTGMTLRDYFAAKAMLADMSSYSGDLIYESPDWFVARAEQWYVVADAMLKAREQ